MCLADVTGVPKKSTGLGWKVFKEDKGKITPENRGYAPYDYDVWYDADAEARYREAHGDSSFFKASLGTERNGRIEFTRTYYPNGFHILLRREDARAFALKHPGTVVRQVEYRGAHTQGNGSLFVPGPQVIAKEIKFLKPRPGGSAYARKSKVAIVPAPPVAA